MQADVLTRQILPPSAKWPGLRWKSSLVTGHKLPVVKAARPGTLEYLTLESISFRQYYEAPLHLSKQEILQQQSRLLAARLKDRGVEISSPEIFLPIPQKHRTYLAQDFTIVDTIKNIEWVYFPA